MSSALKSFKAFLMTRYMRSCLNKDEIQILTTQKFSKIMRKRQTISSLSLVQSDIPHLPLPLRLTFCHLLISGALLIKRMGRRLSERLAVKRNSFLFDIRFWNEIPSTTVPAESAMAGRFAWVPEWIQVSWHWSCSWWLLKYTALLMKLLFASWPTRCCCSDLSSLGTLLIRNPAQATLKGL